MGESINCFLKQNGYSVDILYGFVIKSTSNQNKNMRNPHADGSSQAEARSQLLEDVVATAPGDHLGFDTTLVSLLGEFLQQLLQRVAASRHGDVAVPQAVRGAEVVAAVAHVKYLLVLRASGAVLRQVPLQNLPLAQVDGALLAVVRVVGPHLQAPALVDPRRVGEDVIHGGAQLGGLEDPLYEQGVGVGDDDAVDGALVVQDEGQQVRHPRREGDGLHHAADPVGADLLLSCTHATAHEDSEPRVTSVVSGENRTSLTPGGGPQGQGRALTHVIHDSAHELCPVALCVRVFDGVGKGLTRETPVRRHRKPDEPGWRTNTEPRMRLNVPISNVAVA